MHSQDCVLLIPSTCTCTDLCIEGSVRLVVGDNVTKIYLGQTGDLTTLKIFRGNLIQGRVELCSRSDSAQPLDYHTLCTDNWTNLHASVVCQELGFSPYGRLSNMLFFLLCPVTSVVCMVSLYMTWYV